MLNIGVVKNTAKTRAAFEGKFLFKPVAYQT
jgi:hypothetical protein